ncbi:MAG: hypothetical protein WD670_00955 [Actinomycetota bacterium]
MLTLGLPIVVFALPASAQYPLQDAICGVAGAALDPGEQVVMSGEGWEPGSTVKFVLKPPPEGLPLGSTTVNADGTFSAVLTIPDRIGLGPHTIECRGVDAAGKTIVLVNDMQILGGVTAFTGPSGVSVPLSATLAVGLFLAGSILLVLGHLRPRRSGAAGF